MKLLSKSPGKSTGLVLAGLLLAALLPLAGAARDSKEDAAGKLKAGTENLGQVRAKIEAANQRIDRARRVQNSQRTAVEAAERKIAATQAELNKLDAETEAGEAAVKAAEARRKAAEARLAASRELLARQVRAAYVAGQGGSTALLLSQDQPDLVGRLLSYFDYLNRASAQQLDRINADIAAVTAEQAVVAAELAELKAAQASRQRVLAQLEADRLGRRKAVADLTARIANEKEGLKTLQDSEKDIQALLKLLRDALTAVPSTRPPATQKPFTKSRGTLAWPLRGDIIANYGDAKRDSRLQWKGLWIAASEGAAVRASAAGRVAYVGWLSSYGLIVVIEHDNSFFTLYGHNATVAKAAGDEVNVGDVIAAVGNTGGYERSGLYFEVRKGTEPLDPRGWLVP